MAKRTKSSQEPADLLSRHTEEIRETLAAFQPFYRDGRPRHH